MGEAAPGAEAPLFASCPKCRKSYAVRAAQAGKTAKCRQCGETFVIEPRAKGGAGAQERPPTAGVSAGTAASGAAPAAGASGGATGGGLLCPICQAPTVAGDETTACPECKTVHHRECWEYNKGCGLYGCARAPETEKLQEIEIPASYWGQTEKGCPRCGKVIQAAAVRCRHCGETFETARPQEVGEFAAKESQKAAMVTHRRMGVVLLILAVIPCCAPVAAVVGIIWYVIARREIAAMPPLQATICRLAVGIAVGVSLFIGAVAALHSVLK